MWMSKFSEVSSRKLKQIFFSVKCVPKVVFKSSSIRSLFWSLAPRVLRMASTCSARVWAELNLLVMRVVAGSDFSAK